MVFHCESGSLTWSAPQLLRRNVSFCRRQSAVAQRYFLFSVLLVLVLGVAHAIADWYLGVRDDGVDRSAERRLGSRRLLPLKLLLALALQCGSKRSTPVDLYF